MSLSLSLIDGRIDEFIVKASLQNQGYFRPLPPPPPFTTSKTIVACYSDFKIRFS